MASEKTSSARAWMSGISGILMTACCLCPFSLFSLYIQSICTDLSVGVGQVSIASSLWTVGCFIAAFFIGKLYEKVNTKVLVAIGAVTIFLFQFAISASHSLIPIYICAFLDGAGAMLCGMAMAQITISKWFVKKQGTMMSLCMVVSTLLMVVLFTVVGGLVQSAGYRSVTLVIGIIAGVGGIISVLLVSGDPAKKRFIAGTVYDPEKMEIVEGADMSIKSDAIIERLTRTDDWGDFVFDDLPKVDFTITIKKGDKKKTL